MAAPGNEHREHQGVDPLLAQSVVDSLNDEPYYPAGTTDVMATPPVDLEYESGHVPAGATPSAPLQVSHMPSSSVPAQGPSAADDTDTPIARQAAAAIEALSGVTRLPKPDKTRVLVVANQKGGVGKTTTTVNLAASLAQAGSSVLVIDLDPQGNASTALSVEHHADVPSVYDVLIERYTMDEVVQQVPEIPNLYCCPATIDLAGAEIELVSMVARENRLAKALSGYQKKMDYVLIDCPPSLGLLTVNAMVAGAEVLIPIQCEYYALEGLSQLLHNIELIRGHLNPELHVSTILLTMYDSRTRLSTEVAEQVRTHFPNEVLSSAIPRSVRVSEAPSYGQTVMTWDPVSTGAIAYRDAAREIAERGASRIPMDGMNDFRADIEYGGASLHSGGQ
ncbi:ParA family protein [Catenulispora sp. NF23]|uniref:ParA family protein n=2 Tax=Catenulispora pinistramenti TaxID=2705254 RepID=A0ABS5KXB7_9ACTN|nr:ParA family protein [Catenulispora pinistramenti]MBS2534053.1 ParA family protein [Catenulispora pinistramenti]MBS2550681.1 ParA family protein [Catenulispora pinistramenti]